METAKGEIANSKEKQQQGKPPLEQERIRQGEISRLETPKVELGKPRRVKVPPEAASSPSSLRLLTSPLLFLSPSEMTQWNLEEVGDVLWCQRDDEEEEESGSEEGESGSEEEKECDKGG